MAEHRDVAHHGAATLSDKRAPPFKIVEISNAVAPAKNSVLHHGCLNMIGLSHFFFVYRSRYEM